VSIYDTLDHQIGGVSQQQSGDQSLSFTSQYGVVRLFDLPMVSGAPVYAPAPEAPVVQAPVFEAALVASMGGDEIFSRLERLGDLVQKGILTNEEFAAKKAELLARL